MIPPPDKLYICVYFPISLLKVLLALQESLKATIQGICPTATVTYVLVERAGGATKFFARDPKSGKTDNPPGGAIIDSEVTLRDWYDFYLVPMNVSQGKSVFNFVNLFLRWSVSLRYRNSHIFCSYRGNNMRHSDLVIRVSQNIVQLLESLIFWPVFRSSILTENLLKCCLSLS